MKIIIGFLLILLLIGCSTTKTVEPEGLNETQETAPAAQVTPPEVTPVQNTTPTVTPNTTAQATPVVNTTHTVNVKTDGFDPKELTIKVGETIVWKNVRTGRYDKAFIIGTLGVCRTMKSTIYGPGEEFSYTFNEAGKCTYTDGVYTTLTGKITIE